MKKIDVLGYAFISKPKYKIPKQTPKEYDCAKTSTLTCGTTNGSTTTSSGSTTTS